MLQVSLRRFTLSAFRHWGAFGLFFLAMIDSSPIPTFCGPDILTVVLAVKRPELWWMYAAVAAAGSTIGAYLTFRLARKAGQVYLEDKFGKAKVQRYVEPFQQQGTSFLIASCAIPFPWPTSVFFAAAGASRYGLRKFIVVVLLSRGVRYSIIGALTARYGREVSRVLLHPAEHWGWLLMFTVCIVMLAAAGLLLNRRVFVPARPAPSR